MTPPIPPIDGPVICTASGLYVEPLDLDPALVRAEDIAHHLGNQCRFTGAVSDFYSVGEHSVRCLWYAQEMGATIMEQRWTLMHDASEYVLQDVSRPLKVDPYFGKAYRGAESRAQAVICDVFGLPRKEPAIVKEADNILLATERRDLMPPGPKWAVLEGIEPLPDVIKPWAPRKARLRFLMAYHQVFTRSSE